jgi:hypothetical protein
MPDRGLAPLAAALHTWRGHGFVLRDEASPCNCWRDAAAILAALDGWTLVPVGPISVMVEMVTDDNERMEATIATLRAALDEIANLRTASGLTKHIARAALAQAKETTE